MTAFMTKIEGVPDSNDVVPGMAFFAGTGPADKTCGDCAHRGYYRESQTATWSERQGRDVFRTYKVTACAMFKAKSGRNGPPVPAACKSCKYFEQRPNP